MSKRLRLAVVFASGSLLGFGPMALAAGPEGSLRTSGYIDVQWQAGHGTLEITNGGRMPGPGSGFLVNQGAVNFNHESERFETLVDIPFRRGSYLDNTTTPPGLSDTSGNELELATGEAQAWIRWGATSNMNVMLGQFDSPFGTESNDASEVFFPQRGVMREFVGTTHTGAMVNYSWLPFSLQLIAANGKNTGRQPTNRDMEFAFRAEYSGGAGLLAAGLIYNNVKGTYPQAGQAQEFDPRILAQVMGQLEFRKLQLSAEVNAVRSEYGKAFSQPANRVDHDLVTGILVQGIFEVTEKLGVGLRYEFLRNDETNIYVTYARKAALGFANSTPVGQGGNVSRMSLATKYDLSDQVQAKAGVDFNSVDIGSDAGGKQVSFVTGSVAAVYSF